MTDKCYAWEDEPSPSDGGDEPAPEPAPEPSEPE